MYNTLSITGTNVLTNNSGEAVTVTLTPLSAYFDATGNVKVNLLPVTTTSDVNGNWTLTGVPDPTPDGSGIPWKLVVQDKNSGTTLYSQDVQPAFSQGTSQHWLSLTLPPTNAGITTHMGLQGQPGPAGPTGPVGAAARPRARPTAARAAGAGSAARARPRRPVRPRRPPQRARAQRPAPRGRPAWSR